MAQKKITELTELTAPASTFYFPVEEENAEETKRISLGSLIDSTLATSGKAADAKATGDAIAKKVEKVTGKGLSTEDYTTAEKTKLGAIETEANKTIIDASLTQTGNAADAKATGDRLIAAESEITTVKEDLNDNKADVIVSSASGAIASFSDGANNLPMKSVVCNIEPVQAGTGDPAPDNVRAISGWTETRTYRTGKNIFGGTEFITSLQEHYANIEVDTTNKKVRYSPSAPEGYWQLIGNARTGSYPFQFKDNTQYTFIFKIDKPETNTNLQLGVSYTDGTNSGGLVSQNADSEGWLVFTSASGKTVRSLYGGQYSPGYGTWIYYDQIGIFEGILTKAQFEAYIGNTYTTALGQTVYGGTLDVVSGMLTVDRLGSDMGDIEWINYKTGGFKHTLSDAITHTLSTGDTNLICSMYKTMAYSVTLTNGQASIANHVLYAVNTDYTTDADAFQTGMVGQKVVYKLATPQTYQLTPTQVKSLLGANNVFCDTGDVTAEYRADTKLYIDGQIATLQALVLEG